MRSQVAIAARLAFAILAISAGIAKATTYYVATTGSNANTGTSTGAPWRDIAFAVGRANPGDAIEVRAGTYTENVIISRPGSANAWIVLRAFAGETPVLRSTGAGPTVYIYHADCDEGTIGDDNGNVDCRPMYWEIRGLRIEGSVNGGGDGNAIKIDTPRVRLIGNRLCCAKADVVKLVRTANDVEILDNEIWQDSALVVPSTNAQGIDMVGGDRLRVAGNYIHDVPDIGVYAKGNARDALFERNLLVHIGGANAGHALMLGQSTDADRLLDGDYESYDGLVRNNVVIDTAWSCLAVSSSFNARFYNNACYNTGQNLHGSILLSNESEIGQRGLQYTFVNNIVYGSSARPVFKIGSDAMSDYTSLVVARNLYYTGDGAPRFVSSDFFSTPVTFAQWQTQFQALTGHADNSLVGDPLYTAITGATPLMIGANSPALNTGQAVGALVPNDYRGLSRPIGAGFDIGAYEVGTSDRYLCDGFENAGC